MKSQDPVIEFRNVSKFFQDTNPAVKDLTFDIFRGELTVVIGPSGSGKSTTLQMINGLVEASNGEITVLGYQVSQKLKLRALRSIRSKIGFVFQDFGLTLRLSAIENVLIGSLSKLRGPRLGIWSYPAQFRARAMLELEKLGLEEVAFQRADTLSGGQKQRVAIARALMQQPEILLADEPVASLDPKSSETILEALCDVATQRDVAVIVSLHQVELALKYADRIIGIRKGHIVFDLTGNKPSATQIKELYEK